MKSYEIRKIGAGSVFKFYFVVGVVFGLLISLIFILTGASLQSMGIHLGNLAFSNGGAFQIGAAFLGVIIGSLAYGLVAGLTAAIGAFIYNIFAAAIGGITVKLNDKE